MEEKDVEKSILAHGTAKAFKLNKGDLVKIETAKGGQCSDLTFETFSALMTADTNKHVLGRKRPVFEIYYGMALYDNASKPILRIIENKSRSTHTMLLPGCRKEIFDGKKKGCLDLISEALELPRERVPSCVSFFFDLEDGEVIPSTAQPGDYVVLEVLKDVIVGITSCPAVAGPWSTKGVGRYPSSAGTKTPNINPSEVIVTIYRSKK